MRKKFTKLAVFTACLLLAGGSLSAQDILFEVDFTKWAGSSSIKPGTAGVTENGITFYASNVTREYKFSTTGMTWGDQNYSSTNVTFILIPLDNINGSITINAWDGTSNTRFNYKFLTSFTGTGDAASPSTSATANPSTVTIDNITATNGFIALGRQGSGYTTITKIQITTPTPDCTDAGFSFPDTNIDINDGENLTALTLTNTDNLIDVVYISSNENAVAVDATSGALTQVGTGTAIITASAPRQDIGGTLYCAAEASYTVRIKSTSSTLESTESSIDLKLGKFDNSKSATFTISGYNLTGDASVSDLPAGFELIPATFAVANGEVEQEFQLVYSENEAVAETTEDLTFMVGATTVVVPVTFGKEAQTEWTEVSGSAIWNFSGQVAAQVDLTDATIPAKNQFIVLADLPGLAPTSEFDAAALKVRGERLTTVHWQGDSILLKVENSGMLEVVFSNTGNRSNEYERRYLNVQGNIIGQDDTSKGSKGTSDDDLTTVSDIPVTAGDVVIYGVLAGADGNSWNTAQYLRYFKIAYTPDLTSIHANNTAKTVVSETYYTLTGMQIFDIENAGIYIKKIIFDDGSVETVKFVK